MRPTEAAAALWPRSGAKWQPRVRLSGNPGDGRGPQHDRPHPRGRWTAPSSGSFEARGPWGRGSRRARVGAAPASSREGPADRRSDPLSARPPPPPPRRGGAQAGGGAPGGRGVISSLLPEAPLALRWEPSRRASRFRRCCGERGEGGGWRWEAGDGPDPGPRKNTPPRPLPLPLLRAPAAGPRRSPHPPHRAPPGAGGGPGPELGRRSSLPPGRPGAEDSPWSTDPGLAAPAAPRAPAAPGKCAAHPLPQPCPRPVQAPGWEGRPEGSLEDPGLHCVPAPRTYRVRCPNPRAETGRAGFRSGRALGTGSSSGNFN